MILNKQAYLLSLLVILIWATNFVVIKIGIQEIKPLMLLAGRFTLAGLIFLPFCRWPGLSKALQIASIGLFMGLLHQGLLYVGVQYIDTGLMSIILQSNVIVVTFLGILFFKEKIGWRTWAGIAIAMTGVFILVYKPNSSVDTIGYAMGLASAFFLAFAYMMMKKIDQTSPATYMVFMHLPIAPFIMATSLFLDGTEWIDRAHTLNWPIILSIIIYQATVLSFSHIIWQRLLVSYPVSKIVPLTLTIPVFAVLSAVLFLQEKVTITMIAGGLITLIGVGIITIRRIQKSVEVHVEQA